MTKKCSNTDCGIQYHVEDEKNDNKCICKNPKCSKEYETDNYGDGFCSFACWNSIYCKQENKKDDEKNIFFDMSDVLQ